MDALRSVNGPPTPGIGPGTAPGGCPTFLTQHQNYITQAIASPNYYAQESIKKDEESINYLSLYCAI